jgi:DNA-binding CsgD family transcriptional regulator
MSTGMDPGDGARASESEDNDIVTTDDIPRFGVPRNGPDLSDRVSQLERHMRRIAIELEAAGVISWSDVVPDPESLPGLDDLSPRQWEILRRLLRGERVPGIAGALFISQSTVRNHLSDMFRKVGVNSQEQLLALLRANVRAQSQSQPLRDEDEEAESSA